MKKIYIVTGSTGFVGNNVVKALCKRGDTVIAMAQTEKKAAVALANVKPTIIYGDVLQIDKLESLFEEAKRLQKNEKNAREIVFIHVASVVYLGGDKKTIRKMMNVNVNGTRNVTELCLKYNCRLLYVSSVHAIPEAPKRGLITEVEKFDHKKVIGHYAKSKAQASQFVMNAVKNDGLDAVIVHPSGITGPNDFSNTHLAQMVLDYQHGRIPAATNGGYDFVDVRDVADGILTACDKGKAGDCYLLTNKYYTVKEMLDILHDLTHGKKVKLKVPRMLAKMSLPFMAVGNKFTKRRPLYSRYSLYTLGSNSNFSHERATKELGYKPRELTESLRDMVKFLENQK